MPPDLLDVTRSLRRSRVRCRLLRALARRRRAYLQQLADDASVDARAASMAIHGKLPFYAPERSLVRIGVLRRRRPRGSREAHYEITRFGDAVSAQLDDLVR